MIRKLLKAAVVVAVASAVIENGPFESVGGILAVAVGIAWFGFLIFKVVPAVCRGAVRTQSRVSSGLEQSVSGAVNGLIMGGGSSREAERRAQAQARRQEADRRARERYRAQGEARYHEYYARKNAGTYDGYVSANRAQAARNRAKRL